MKVRESLEPRVARNYVDGADSRPTLFALRAELRAQTQSSAHLAVIGVAENLASEAVSAWWKLISAGKIPLRAPVEESPARPSEALRSAAAQFGATAAELPITDAAYHLSLLYTSLLPNEWRSQHGIHYTPPLLANRLLDQAEAAGLDWSTAKILDPAAGAGAFLIPALQRMSAALKDCTPAIALQNLTARVSGYELHAFAAWLGQVFLDAALLPLAVSSGRRPREMIAVRDSLNREIGTKRFDLVIGNPPFGRLRLPASQRARFARSLYGHANLYGVFTDLAVQLARDGGLVSFLTPSSFLAGEYFKNLRALLWREAPPVAIDFVTPRKGVFEDVLQETVLATYQKGGNRRSARVSFIHPEAGQPVMPESAGQLTLPRIGTAPWLLPRHMDEAVLVRKLRTMPERLADWGYKISTGPLVWNRFKPQLSDRAGKGIIPLVWAESVTSDGRFVFRSERRNHKPYFRLLPGDEWLVVRSPCVLLQRTTAKEQARRLIAAEMPATFLAGHDGLTVENHLNMLIPLSARPAVSPALLAAFLNTTAADRAFRCLSGSVAVSAYELENLPLPGAEDMKRHIGQRWNGKTVESAAAALYAEDHDRCCRLI